MVMLAISPNCGAVEIIGKIGKIGSIWLKTYSTPIDFRPDLASIFPANTEGPSGLAKYDEVYFKNETKPLIRKMVNTVDQDPEVGGGSWHWCLIWGEINAR